jgi:galactokinase
MAEELPEPRVRDAFEERFHAAPQWVVRAPGSVNLLGGPADDDAGPVLALAIDRGVWIAARSRADSQLAVRTLDGKEDLAFALDRLEHATGSGEYLKGAAWALQQTGQQLQGWEGVLAGNVPPDVGLGSSSALVAAALRTFAAGVAIPWEPTAMAQIARRAKTEWVGARCNAQGPACALSGRAGHAMLVDPRAPALETLPLPTDVALVVLDVAARSDRIEAGTAERQRQCAAATQLLGVPALRDVTPERFAVEGGRLDEATRKRARHVVSENARVSQAVDALRRGDGSALGNLLNASHASLRDDYGVSSRELDALVACGRRDGTCLGIRMAGPGCAVALVMSFGVTHFLTAIRRDYRTETGLNAAAYVCQAANGAELVAS